MALVVVLALLAFAPWWAGGRVYAPLDLLDGMYAPWSGPDATGEVHNHFTADAVTQYLVYRAFAERSFGEDGFIGWREAVGGGRAEEANTMAGYADWTMQLHRVFDFWTAWHLGLLGQFLIAALGMYAFLRGQRLLPLVALLGAIAFGANTQFVAPIYHRWHLAGFAWIPWLAWSMYAYRDGRRWAWPLAPAFLALSLLGGNLQTNAFTALVVASLWAGWLWEAADRRTRLATTGHVAAWSVLGLGLAAFALVPETLALLATVTSGTARGGLGYVQGPLQPLASLLLIPLQAFPTLLGSPRTLDLTKPLGADLFELAYFGFVPMLLAFRTLFVRPAPAPMKVLILLGLLLPLTPLVGPLYHRVQLLFIFGGVWAAAWFWQNAPRDRVDRVLRVLFGAFIAVAAAWLAVSVVGSLFQDRLTATVQASVAGRVEPERLAAFPFYRAWMEARAGQFVHESWIWHPRQALAVATALAGFAALWWRVRAGVAASAAVVCVLVAIELGAFAAGWVTVVEPGPEGLYPVTPELALVRERVGDGRLHIVHGDPVGFLPPNTHEMIGLSAIQQYESILPPGLAHVAAARPDAATLGALGVSHAVTRADERPEGGWVLDYRGDRLALWRNDHALPRYLVALRDGDAASASVLEATQNRRLLELPAAPATSLRIAENWATGWRYRVDAGDWAVPERRADGGMLVPLPSVRAGALVELRYRPDRRGGGPITILSLLVWGAAVLATAVAPAFAGRV